MEHTTQTLLWIIVYSYQVLLHYQVNLPLASAHTCLAVGIINPHTEAPCATRILPTSLLSFLSLLSLLSLLSSRHAHTCEAAALEMDFEADLQLLGEAAQSFAERPVLTSSQSDRLSKFDSIIKEDVKQRRQASETRSRHGACRRLLLTIYTDLGLEVVFLCAITFSPTKLIEIKRSDGIFTAELGRWKSSVQLPRHLSDLARQRIGHWMELFPHCVHKSADDQNSTKWWPTELSIKRMRQENESSIRAAKRARMTSLTVEHEIDAKVLPQSPPRETPPADSESEDSEGSDGSVEPNDEIPDLQKDPDACMTPRSRS